MSDSVDRVFVHALATVRRLPRTGSSRPPPAARLQLYGLYKQSMEGDVEAILPRPTLPPASPNPHTVHASNGGNIQTGNNGNVNNNSVHRYASRDLRTREAQAEIEKWDAWHTCAGMSRTEAKRKYISTLIETMKEYASGTSESRELVGELEFVWNQIKSQSGSDPDDNGENSPEGSRTRSTGETGSGSGGTGRSTGSKQKEPESPTRKLERAGLKNPVLDYGRRSESGDQLSGRATGAGGSSSFSRRSDTLHSDLNSNAQRKRRIRTDSSGLRILSPVSQRDSDSESVVEAIDDADPEADDIADGDDNDGDEDGDEDDQNLNTAPTSPIVHSSRPRPPAAPPEYQLTSDIVAWQSNIENHLRHLATEIAALREQMSANHLLSSSSFSHTYYALSKRQRIWHRIRIYLWVIWKQTWRQAAIQGSLLVLAIIWGRWTGDRRLEKWVREKLTALRKRFQLWLGRESMMGWWIRRLLRIS